MATRGWHYSTLALGGLLVLIAAALVFQVHRAVSRLRGQSDAVRAAARDAEAHYVRVLRRVVRFVEARDRFSRGHSERVGRLAEQIARRLGLAEPLCRALDQAGQLHDIGLLAVSGRTLAQPSSLGADDFRQVRKHPEVGYEVLKPLEMLADVLPAIRHHHERMNGTGYPAGLAGEAVPLGARVLAVADSYDAMTHDRPHRPAVPPAVAMDELRRCCPHGYDPRCVEALAAVLDIPPRRRKTRPQPRHAEVAV